MCKVDIGAHGILAIQIRTHLVELQFAVLAVQVALSIRNTGREQLIKKKTAKRGTKELPKTILVKIPFIVYNWCIWSSVILPVCTHKTK